MPIFNKLKVLGNLADNMVEGKFNSEIIDFKEGERFIFYKFMLTYMKFMCELEDTFLLDIE